MAQVLICFNVLSNYVMASKIDKLEKGEKSLLRLMLPEIKTKATIFILDKGYGNFSICKMFEKQNHKYCIWLTSQISSFVKIAMTSVESDFMPFWEPSKIERSNCKQLG